MARYTEIEKDKRIKADLKKLKRIFKDLPAHKRQMVDGLIEQAAFLRVSIEDLQNDINENGYSTQSPQGVKKRPEADLHISMSKNYQAVVKQLSDISSKNIPDIVNTAEAQADKEFDHFLKDGDHE